MGATCECVCKNDNGNSSNSNGALGKLVGSASGKGSAKDDVMAMRSSLIGEEILFCRLGKDTRDVTENFQYHGSHIEKHKIKLSYSDQFYREAFKPMYLMHFTYFNKLLDDFLQWYGVQSSSKSGIKEQELVCFEKFQQYFLDSHKKLIDKNGPMVRVLKFRGMFVYSYESVKDDERFPKDDPFF